MELEWEEMGGEKDVRGCKGIFKFDVQTQLLLKCLVPQRGQIEGPCQLLLVIILELLCGTGGPFIHHS